LNTYSDNKPFPWLNLMTLALTVLILFGLGALLFGKRVPFNFSDGCGILPATVYDPIPAPVPIIESVDTTREYLAMLELELEQYRKAYLRMSLDREIVAKACN
jgi:hypothetical protein